MEAVTVDWCAPPSCESVTPDGAPDTNDAPDRGAAVLHAITR